MESIFGWTENVCQGHQMTTGGDQDIKVKHNQR